MIEPQRARTCAPDRFAHDGSTSEAYDRLIYRVGLIREANSHAFLAGLRDGHAQRDMWKRLVACNLQKPNVPFRRPAQWLRIHATTVGKVDLDLTVTIAMNVRSGREYMTLRGYDDAVGPLTTWYLDLDGSN